MKASILVFCVIDSKGIQTRRQFQSGQCLPCNLFKSVADGFAPTHARNILPKGGEQ